MRAAKTDRFLGKTDWRLPTLAEGITIVGKPADCVIRSPGRAVSTLFQPWSTYGTLGWIWTSSPFSGDSIYAQQINFAVGGASHTDRDRTSSAILVRAGHTSSVSEFKRELAKTGQFESTVTKSGQQMSQTSNPQKNGDYTNLFQNQRGGSDFQTVWQATCQSGGRAIVSKRDDQSSVCFYRQGSSARCESIGVEAAMRKACAD